MNAGVNMKPSVPAVKIVLAVMKSRQDCRISLTEVTNYRHDRTIRDRVLLAARATSHRVDAGEWSRIWTAT